MSTSGLGDAFAHHVWATERLIDACAPLTREQLVTFAEGTYGPILATLGHLVAADAWYLFVITGRPEPTVDDSTSLEEMRRVITDNGAAWQELLAQGIDPETDIAEREDAAEFHVPLAVRLAQAIHHGTDHRSQVCTALTTLGFPPPEIDVWAYAEATGRSRATDAAGFSDAVAPAASGS
jgi:uncharacterized damage-inducible protein DinB